MPWSTFFFYKNAYSEYRFLDNCMAFAEWVQLIHSAEDAGVATRRCSVMFSWFPFEYGSCQLWQDALYFCGRQLLFTSSIAVIGYSKLSVLHWVSLTRLFTVFLRTIWWPNDLKTYHSNLVFIAQPNGLKAFSVLFI